MATETLYADAHITGNVTNPDNAIGNTPSTWAGVTNANTSATSRWSLANPVDPLAAGQTHTLSCVVRKGSNTGDPSVVLTLFDNGTSVKGSGSVTVTSTTGQTVSVTFTTSEVSNGANVEAQLAITGAAGGGTARNSAQVSHFTFTAETAPVATAPAAVNDLSATAGDGEVVLTWTAPADGGAAITDYIVQYRVKP
jgi:hypothetical protein